jgi:hypothetical protein
MTGWLSPGHPISGLTFFVNGQGLGGCMMLYHLYDSVDELLAPETLTRLIGQPVQYVRCLPKSGGFSGSHLLTVETNNGATNGRFVLKRMASQWDWLMNSTADRHCRSVTLWQAGFLDQLQPSIDHAILACACDGDGWAILMRDVTPTLLGERIFTAKEVYCSLDAMAVLHATFWDMPGLEEPTLGLCDTLGIVRTFSPEIARRIPSTTSILPKASCEGWELLQVMVDPDVVGLLQQLVLDPQPLCAALARYPKTLVHGDYRGMNAGIRWQNPPQVVLLDWQLAGCGAATIDLAWFINQPRVRLSPVTTEAGIAYYRQRLAEQLGSRFDGESWEPLLNLGLLANILRMGCFTAWFILHSEDETEPPILRKTLHLFNQQARMASKWL